MWIFGGFKGAERVYVECTAGCPNEAARRAHWVPPADFVAGGRLRAAAAAAVEGPSAVAEGRTDRRRREGRLKKI